MIDEPVIEVNKLTNVLGGQTIHQHLNLTICRGHVVAVVGGSGCGKTTLLRSILSLLKPKFGTITVLGTDITSCSDQEKVRLQQRWGMLFQHNALFSSLTVLENVMFPLQEYADLDFKLMREIALLKIKMAGLSPNVANRMPSELSGGMQKRAGLARAIALDPELLFLDEPTAGLDPQSAAAFDELVIHLRNALGLTIVIVTHDLDTIYRVTDRVAFLGEGRVLAYQPIKELERNPNPLIQQYFSGVRAQRLKQQQG